MKKFLLWAFIALVFFGLGYWSQTANNSEEPTTDYSDESEEYVVVEALPAPTGTNTDVVYDTTTEYGHAMAHLEDIAAAKKREIAANKVAKSDNNVRNKVQNKTVNEVKDIDYYVRKINRTLPQPANRGNNAFQLLDELQLIGVIYDDSMVGLRFQYDSSIHSSYLMNLMFSDILINTEYEILMNRFLSDNPDLHKLLIRNNYRVVVGLEDKAGIFKFKGLSFYMSK